MTEGARRPKALNGLSWGGLLRHYRFTNRMKQTALAEDLGVTQAMVSRWERDKVVPGRAMQVRILDLVNRKDLSEPVVSWRQEIAEAPFIAAVIGPDGEIETVSPGLLREIGCGQSDLRGKRLDEAFEGELPSLYSKLCDEGLFDERVETVESAEVYSFRRATGGLKDFPVHTLSWWRRGEDGRPRWILNGARIRPLELRALREEFGGQIRIVSETQGLLGG